ncbi:MAG TPA: M1 family metallopeptidase, partial [Nitrospiria bacterium]|nr:M1 family metallopeptidase [Nitrospiria bacterium]
MTTSDSGRLPETVKPSRYDLNLTIDPQARKFSGTVSIDLEVKETIRSITLHALDLNVETATFAGNGENLDARITIDAPSETAAMTFERDLSAGAAKLEIGFSGSIGKQLRGLYGVEVDGEVFAFTQLEATDARRMFPCFDEPALKARFLLTVTIPEDLTALSNMPEKETRTQGRQKTVSFEETPQMSTYLLALAVARLESREIQVGPTRIGIWTPPGQIHLCDFALKTTAAVLPLLNDYFDLPYPYPKLDLVSVPDFAMGAMENWGAIFFRDSCLLLDEDRASATNQRGVANVITHEIVHQWFGNLVTMEWWDDLWLNESFATWLACKIVDQWRPEWNSWTEFQQEKQYPLSLDSLKQTRPIHAPVRRSSEIEEMFDALTYEKGAACLRMMEQFLGPDSFRKGIRDYIRKFQFKNARAEHLWEELDRATGQPVSRIARDWFTQPGYPLLTIFPESLETGTLNLRQNRFLSLPAENMDDQSLWTLPYTLRWKDAGGIHAHRGILEERSGVIRLPIKEDVSWIHGNSGESGFFRTAYPAELRKNLEPALTGELQNSEVIGYLN